MAAPGTIFYSLPPAAFVFQVRFQKIAANLLPRQHPAFPVSDNPEEQLDRLEDSVRGCNVTVCEPEDILSYNVYYYDHEERRLCMAKDVIGSSEVYGKELRKAHHLMS